MKLSVYLGDNHAFTGDIKIEHNISSGSGKLLGIIDFTVLY